MKKLLIALWAAGASLLAFAAGNDGNTPDFLQGVPAEKVLKFGPEILTLNNSAKFVTDDPDSVTGKSLASPAVSEKRQHGVNIKPKGGMYSSTISIYNWTAKKQGPSFTLRTFPEDEKFHWYKLWDYEFLPGRTSLLLWWWQIQANLSKVCKAGENNKYTVYVSLKFTGPAYVPGSTKPDGMFIDQVILVPVSE